jgi:hypothetical protein
MSEAFVPFAPKAGAATQNSEPFRAKIVPAQNATVVPFQAAALPRASSNPHPSHGQPQVTVTRDGDKITAIRVICGCGEVMDLRCSY